MLKIAVCDDNKEICDDFRNKIYSWCTTNNINVEICEFYSGEDLIEYFNINFLDVLFLDIELIGIDGVQVGKYIRNKTYDLELKIIFFSSKNSYDRMLFEVSPFDFIEKPITNENVDRIMRKIVTYLKKDSHQFIYKKNTTNHFVLFKDIDFLESDGRYIVINQKNNTKDKFIGSLKDYCDLFLENGFIRPHKSYVVNLRFVKSISNNDLCMKDGQIIKIGRKYKKEIIKKFFEYLVED